MVENTDRVLYSYHFKVNNYVRMASSDNHEILQIIVNNIKTCHIILIATSKLFFHMYGDFF